MQFGDLLRMAWGNLWRIKIRTLLTVGGVLVGISFMVIMVSIGLSLRKTYTDTFWALTELNIIQVRQAYDFGGMPGREAGGTGIRAVLDPKGLESIGHIPGVTALTPIVNLYPFEIRMRRDTFYLSMIGIDFTQLQTFGYSLEEGSQIPMGRAVVLSGYRVPEYMAHFNDPYYWERRYSDPDFEPERADILNKQLEVIIAQELFYEEKPGIPYYDPGSDYQEPEKRTYRLRVGGILKEASSWMVDEAILIPLSLAEEMFEWQRQQRNYFKKNGYEQVYVFVGKVDDVSRVQQGIKELGYEAYSAKEYLDATLRVAMIIQFVLGGIGFIALFIAAIGIVNTLHMSIYERTREIGIIKVVGATLPSIRNLFLLEAGFIGLLGGSCGVFLGWLIGLLLSYIAGMYLGGAGETFTYVFLSPLGVLGTILFSSLIGLAAGLYPAMKAANLSAIAAMRHE
jgi:putative ABC transport system permease protein